ncbi:hypothetical protein V8C35DRAFT_297177 [Trichoderma chlorosporum]
MLYPSCCGLLILNLFFFSRMGIGDGFVKMVNCGVSLSLSLSNYPPSHTAAKLPRGKYKTKIRSASTLIRAESLMPLKGR